ncbi:unnamed protein product [Ilex paraguariensis]|uniref:Uncharacterized protein n=1 Tax=Ilex paraguariensis TaxID=185542 RepID=A0ABC8V097_9AQUA
MWIMSLSLLCYVSSGSCGRPSRQSFCSRRNILMERLGTIFPGLSSLLFLLAFGLCWSLFLTSISSFLRFMVLICWLLYHVHVLLLWKMDGSSSLASLHLASVGGDVRSVCSLMQPLMLTVDWFVELH